MPFETATGSHTMRCRRTDSASPIRLNGIRNRPTHRPHNREPDADQPDHLATTEIYLNLSPEHVIKEFMEKW